MRKRTKKPRVPRLKNILDIKGPLRPGTLIHFSDEQWEQMTSKLTPGKGVPKFGAGLVCYPVPGGYVGDWTCIQGPCEICKPIIRIPRSRFPVPPLVIGCHCIHDHRDPLCNLPPGSSPQTPRCEVEIQRSGSINIGCRNNRCTGRCVARFVRDGHRWVFACQCR